MRARAAALALALGLLLGAGEAAAQSGVCSSAPAAGQRIDCREGGGSADDIRIDAMNLAIPATTSHAIYARHQGSGGIDIDVSGGSLTTTGERDYAVIGWDSGASGDVDISLKDVIARTSNADSHAVIGYRQGGAGDVRIDVQGGSITTEGSGAGSHAVVVWQTGSGDIDIDVKDAAIETQGFNSNGVFGYRTGGGSGNINIDVRGGSVTSKGLGLYGVHAWARNSDGTGDIEMVVAGAVVTMERRLASAIFAENAGTGDLVVKVSDGAVARADGERSIGVRAVHGGNGGIILDLSGETVIAVEGGDSAGVQAYHTATRAVANENTTIDMTIGAGARISAPFASGVQGRLGGSNTAGVAISHAGSIRARDTGILAWASLSSGIEILRLADHEGMREPMIHVVSGGDITVGAGVMDAYVREFAAGTDEVLSAGERAVLGAIEAEDSDALEAALAALPGTYADAWKARARGFLSARDLSMTDQSQAVTITAEEREADRAMFEILGIPRAGIRAMAIDHERISGYIRISDQDPAILAIDAASRTPEQRATLQEQRALSAAERKVLEASLLGGDLEAALEALSADYTEAEKRGIRLRATYYNEGDIRVDVTGGTILSEGDGVHARYILPNDRNGAITVTVAKGASVSGGRNGIYVGSAGLVEGSDALRDQSVTVNGRVSGGTGAGVYMKGGGRLMVGAAGVVGATSGVGVLADGSGDLIATVAGRIEGDVRNAGGALMLTTTAGSVITGTVHDPVGPVVVPGSVGRILLAEGGEVAVPATGALTGVEVDGGTEALRSEAGDLRVSIAGRVTGDIRSLGGDLTAIISGVVEGDVEGLGAGDHAVTVSEGGVVTGEIHLAASAVTVDGTVGSVRFDGGGTLTVGPTGRILSRAGAAVSNAEGDLGVTIRVASGERPDQAAARVQGRIEGAADGETTVTLVGASGRAVRPGAIGSREAAPSGAYDVGVSASAGGGVSVTSVFAPRARVYEALPSVLLGMSGLLSHEERMASPRSSRGVWARVEGASGDWKADASTSGGVEYEARRYGVRVGVDASLGANALLGFSAHHGRGSADVEAGGDIEVSGNGLGVSASYMFGGGLYLDGQVEATWHEAGLESDLRGKLKAGVSGFGWAAGVELGRRVESAGLLFTPSARLTRASVSLDKFTDAVGSAVSLEDGDRFTGGVGMRVEKETGAGRLFGAVGFEHDFSAKTSVEVSDVRLESEGEPSRLRLRAGGVRAWGDGEYAIRGAVDYATSGDGHEVGGSLSLQVRF